MAALLLIGTTAHATDHKHLDHQDRVTKRYRQAQPIVFIQGGVKFFVHTDGSVDFKILNRRSRSQQVRWHGQATPGAYRYNPYRNMVRYDYYGRLKRVKSNHISYNRYNQVRRIGTIVVRYNRRGLVSQIGGLHIHYRKHGNIKFVEGNVYYNGCGHCGMDGCTATHDPYYHQNRRPKYQDRWHGDYHHKNRKRYHDDDDDD